MQTTYKKYKNQQNQLYKAIMLSLLGIGSAYAADEAKPADDAAERVEVTGSRLKGVDLEGASPVVVVTAEEIEKRGYDNISDFLKDLPQTATAGTFSTAGQTAGGVGVPAGSAAVSLRGLGSDSTLVLVNGRRIAVNAFASGTESFVDVDAIPMAAIERIEVLTDGASAVYGSDAIAGVVNFILRKDYTGQRVSLMYGDDTDKTDGSKYNAYYVGGFATDNSNTMLMVDYFGRNAIYNSDRDVDVTFWAENFYYNLDYPNNDFATPNCASGTIVPTLYGEGCRFDYVSYRPIQSDKEQLGVTLTHNYQLNSSTEFFAEAMYQNRTGHAYQSPARLRFNLPWDYAYSPSVVIDSLLDEGGLAGDRIRLNEYTPERRVIEYDTVSTRLLLGLRGSVGEWDWETSLSHGKVENEDTYKEGYWSRNAVDDAIAAETLNPWDWASNDAANLAALRGRASRVGESELTTFDFRLNGDIGELAGGAIASVVGVEYRDETVSDRPSEALVNNDLFGTSITSSDGDRDAYAVFAEMNLPFTSQFDITLSARFDDYGKGVGDTFNPRVAARYKATDNLIFRTSWGTAFRAPSIIQVTAGETAYEAYLACSPSDPYVSFCGADGRARSEWTFLTTYSGNENLKPEESESFNFGVSWNASDDLQFTVDYWRYDFENVINEGDAYTLDLCLRGELPMVNDPADLAGGFGCVVDGDPTDPEDRSLVDLYSSIFNTAAERTDGIDLRTKWRMAEDWRLNFIATQTLSYERKDSATQPYQDLLGSLETAREIGRPELVYDITLTYLGDSWETSLSAHYVDELKDGDFAKLPGDDGIRGTYDDTPWQRTIDSWLTWDLSVTYDFTDDAWISLAVSNLTDEKPPFAASPTKGYASDVHDFFGRVASIRYTHSF